MSSFSSGNLFRLEHLAVARQLMQPDSYIVECGDSWGAYLTKHEGWPPPLSGSHVFPPDLLRMSAAFPLLLWSHPQDYGWGFALLSGGQVISSMNLDYEDFITMIHPNQVSEKQVANMMLSQLLGQEPQWLEHPSREDLEATFDNICPDHFRLLDLDDRQITALREALVPAHLWQEEQRYELVETFKKTLRFEMDFINWERVHEFGSDRFHVLAHRGRS